MAFHRKIDTRMYGDKKFCGLSPAKPSAQYLWVYLLTGPHTTALPGLSCVGEASLAESLGWPLKSFRNCFNEITTNAMAKADWSSRVLWIPKSIRYNWPESPNVVRSWSRLWDQIPECDLKNIAFDSILSELKTSEAFAEAFREGCSTTHTIKSKPPSPNQEQEQEQEQEQKRRPPLRFAGNGKPKPNHFSRGREKLKGIRS